MPQSVTKRCAIATLSRCGFGLPSLTAFRPPYHGETPRADSVTPIGDDDREGKGRFPESQPPSSENDRENARKPLGNKGKKKLRNFAEDLLRIPSTCVYTWVRYGRRARVMRRIMRVYAHVCALRARHMRMHMCENPADYGFPMIIVPTLTIMVLSLART